jgi:prepilin-type N-terminal cleavage/methylation domain-containing protein
VDAQEQEEMVMRRSIRQVTQCAGGYTLIETMVALTIFTTAVLAVSTGIMVVMSSSAQTMEYSRATALAVQKLEEIKARPADSIKPESVHSVDANGTVGVGPYTRWVAVADTAGGPDTAGIIVYVTYPTGMMGRKTVKLQTLIYTGG